MTTSLPATLIWLRMNRDAVHKKIIKENVELRKLCGEKERVVFDDPKKMALKAKVVAALEKHPTMFAAALSMGVKECTFWRWRKEFGLIKP